MGTYCYKICYQKIANNTSFRIWFVVISGATNQPNSILVTCSSQLSHGQTLEQPARQSRSSQQDNPTAKSVDGPEESD